LLVFFFILRVPRSQRTREPIPATDQLIVYNTLLNFCNLHVK